MKGIVSALIICFIAVQSFGQDSSFQKKWVRLDSATLAKSRSKKNIDTAFQRKPYNWDSLHLAVKRNYRNLKDSVNCKIVWVNNKGITKTDTATVFIEAKNVSAVQNFGQFKTLPYGSIELSNSYGRIFLQPLWKIKNILLNKNRQRIHKDRISSYVLLSKKS